MPGINVLAIFAYFRSPESGVPALHLLEEQARAVLDTVPAGDYLYQQSIYVIVLDPGLTGELAIAEGAVRNETFSFQGTDFSWHLFDHIQAAKEFYAVQYLASTGRGVFFATSAR